MTKKYKQISYLMTLEETAEYLDMSISTLYTSKYYNKIPCLIMRSVRKYGGSNYYFYRTAVEDYRLERIAKKHKRSDPTYATQHEASNYLNVSKDTIKAYRKEKKVRWYHGDDGRIYILWKDLEKIMKWKGRKRGK